ncbi:MAG: hypothetical protein DRO01_08120 [Thermoproteota archaeon]|nr:MAG: hypothetical protein DRO01_08120 [Candidatus Korarchaeota archaeon]
MDRREIELKLITDFLGVPIKSTTEMDYRMYQGIVYLVQACGVNLGYYYHWSPNDRPVCPALFADIDDIVLALTHDFDESRHFNLSEQIRLKLYGLKKRVIHRQSLGQYRFVQELEKLMTLHFLIDRNLVPRDIETVVAMMRKHNARIDKEAVKTAIGDLVWIGALPFEVDLKE